MELRENKPVLQITGIGFLVYSIQKILFAVFNIDISSFQIPLEVMHIIMLFFSVVIMLILNMVFIKNKDVVGMTFLLLTSIKVSGIYFIGSFFILEEGSIVEKWNFYGLFALYLALETLFTARRLNRTNF
ncbi:hypothetical protein NAT51_00990 [Flavobacterium amniphilum]|uniref:hypothetical protein n=1 Tax=Flavobacterium amniphilum TaxID=1834035 RepID=UPI00202A4C63|nr:hypothetical protein [Flavobacterium amniphilum]MCL9804080.1 hypothetical protein [Flavobacterium amniphilum]